MIHNKILTQHEKAVYSLLREYVKKTKNFNLDDINQYLNFRLGYNLPHDDLKSTILKLYHEKYFSLGSTLTQVEVNSNASRMQILQYIKINPGAYNRLIRRKLKIGSNEFNWHVQILAKFGMVKMIPFGRNVGFFENRSYQGYEYDLFLMQNEKTEKIIQYLQKNPHSNLTQIAKEIHLHYSTIQKHIGLLMTRGIVIINKYSSPLSYQINEILVQKIRKIVNGAIFDEIPKDLPVTIV